MPGSATQMWMESSPSAETISATLQPMAIHRLKMEKSRISGQQKTGSITYGDATWSGSGWTGQPLMEKWSQEVKKSMNMYDWAKEKDDLVEVIYACMDGYVYFLDLETGEATRDPLYLGFTFKGAGALDPRGYPIMYVGAGYDSNEGTARVFVVNLLDCSVMYTFGNNDEFFPSRKFKLL